MCNRENASLWACLFACATDTNSAFASDTIKSVSIFAERKRARVECGDCELIVIASLVDLTRSVENMKAEPLVEAHINSLAVDVIEKHRVCFREFLGHGRRGIYVLRKNREIYYVGLANSLRSRLADHLKIISKESGMSSTCISSAGVRRSTSES